MLNTSFARYNISLAGFNVLFVLWHENGVSQADLPRHVDMDKASLTPVIDALEREGLIERRQDSDDKRRNKLYLTRRGAKLEGPLMKIAVDDVAVTLRGVAPEHVAIMRHGLLAMLANLDENPA